MLIQISTFALKERRAVSFNTLLIMLVIISMTALPTRLLAAPGALSQNPLFLTQGIQPNIFFILDDSGSMDWEVLKSNGAIAVHGSGSNRDDLDFTPNNTTERREHCPGYNVLAYDPTVRYTPWRGNDYAGNAFVDQGPANAHVNPYTGSTSNSRCDYDGDSGGNGGDVSNGNGRTCNLVASGDFGSKGAFYHLWDDANEDGVYQNGECPTNSGSRKYVKDLPLKTSSTDAEYPNSQTNYANWFSYYRKREYVMKRAVSQLIEESQARMGVATINRKNRVLESKLVSNHKRRVGTPIADVDDITRPLDPVKRKNKQILMDNLLAENSSGMTPLRRALNNTGRYFMGNMNNGDLFGYRPSTYTESSKGHSPILNSANGGQCQQNFALLFSDGEWNGSSPGVGHRDNDGLGPYDGGSYADQWDDTLADVAMRYYETDLISGLENDVPEVTLKVGKDENPNQHLVTFTIAFGLTGNITCDPTDRDTPLAGQTWPDGCDPYTAWPEPVNTKSKVDDMRHAAWNGRGQFLSAADPQELIKQMQAAINDIADRTTSSAAAIAVNAGHLQDGDLIYQATFSSSRWSGGLAAYELTSAGVVYPAKWNADDLLDSRDISTRKIITYNGVDGINFDFSSVSYLGGALPTGDLSAVQVGDLLHDAPYSGTGLTGVQKSKNIEYGNDLVAYLRGDTSNEGTLFRKRGGRMGDVVNASPRYVGAPFPLRYPNHIEGSSHPYKAWANASDQKNRTPMLYLGSNDGMLHAFEAETGIERFAYIPHAVFSTAAGEGLHWLADEAYEHRFYVDQTPTVMDAFIETPAETGKKWRTVLVGGLRGGGRALYALDVTDPDDFGADKVLWEFTHPNLGFTYSRPAIVKLKNGKWAAIFGNGYNNDPTGDGKAKLFIVNLATGALIKELSTNVGTVVNNSCSDVGSDCNGLATPAVYDATGNGIVDRVYAGDLKGNMWVFDLSDSNSNLWGLAHGATPLFTAKDAANNPQPITTKPKLSMHPDKKSKATRPNLMVYFGTGQYLTNSDTSNDAGQSFYAIWDSGSATSRHNLLQQTITGASDADRRVFSKHDITYGAGPGEHRGWFMDLPDQGERVVVTPIFFGKSIVYTTIIPTGNICGSAGTSWLMVHDLYDGSQTDYIAIDVNGDTVFNATDMKGSNNVNGVKSDNLQWQPTIVSGDGIGVGKILIPTDDNDNGETMNSRDLQSGVTQSIRGSWARYDF